MAGRMEFEFQFRGQGRAPSFGRGEARLRLALLGDWSGRGARGVVGESDLARRPWVRVDLDSFDQAMGRFSPRLVLAAPVDDRAPEALALSTLDDFHPDQLCRKLEVFAGFRLLRGRLLDASTFAQTADALEPAPAAPAPPQAGEDTLSRLLGGRPAQAPGGADISAFLEQIVRPHITPAADARQPRLVAAVDEAAAHHLRGLLHHPSFQRLEAAWRAVQRLVSAADDGIDLFLLDVSRQELAADLAGGPEGSGLHARLRDPEAAWSMLIVDETFGPGADDLALLSALGAVAAQNGAPLVGAADPRVDWSALDDEAAARWQQLRQSPQAPFLGLALPRWLLRLPYGPKTDPVEAFPFDELGGQRVHESYLWGNPAFACALLAILAFREQGAEMELGAVQELDDLPCHTYREDGESHMQPCAEVFLPERIMTAHLARGLMPLVSARDRNALRLARFQSIADPPAPLAGPWR
jgi:type VI secretion system protein ImpC